MCRGKVRQENEEEEAQPERYGNCKGGAEESERGVVDEEDVESKIDGRDGDEDICRHPHDACAHVSIVRDHACRKVYVP